MPNESEAFDLFADGEGQSEAGVTETQSGGGRETAAPGTTPAAPTTPPPVNAELQTALKDFAESIKSAQAPTQQATPATRRTPEQEAAYWGVFNPLAKDPQFFEKFMRLPADMDPAERQQQVQQFQALFAMMQHGIINQAVTIAQRNFERERAQIEERLTPLQQYYSDQQASTTRQEFYTTYPILNDPKYEGIIKATANSLANQNFTDKPTYYKTLAEGVAKAVQGFVSDFNLGAAPQTKTTRRTTPSLPRTSAGGTGGAGGAGQKTESANQADSLF